MSEKAALSYPDWHAILKDERLPAAVVDLEAFDRNVASLKAIAEKTGKKIRIATKSIRVVALIQRVLRSGAPFSGLMCFSAEEAAFLAEKGFDDFLLAYPTLQNSDLKLLRKLHDSGKKVAMVVDSAEHLALLSDAFKGSAKPFRLLIEVDLSLRFLLGLMHIGVRRSPIRSVDQLKALLAEFKKYPELAAVGMMTYEAQVAGMGDKNPFNGILNPVKKILRELSMSKIKQLRPKLAQAFRESGFALEVFNGGGSGSFNLSADDPDLTELTAGSALLSSHLFDYYSNIRFEPACFFALQAVRRSDKDFVTCLGGGYVASGEPGWDKVPLPYLPEGISLVHFEGTGEVQTPLQGRTAEIPIGGPVLFRHAKAGELAERFKEYLLMSGNRISSRAPTYRGENQCFF